MRPIARELAPILLAAAKSFPAIVLTGPRRAGKTTLLRRAFPEASYHLFTFDCEPPALDELSRVLRITDGAMRHMAVRRPKGSTTKPPASAVPAEE